MPETAAFRGWKAQDAIEWFTQASGRLASAFGRRLYLAERGYITPSGRPLFGFRNCLDAPGEVAARSSPYSFVFSGATSIVVARSLIHSSSVIGLSEVMYLPIACSMF
jgi:hypothetical protein